MQAANFVTAENLQGPAALYEQLLALKTGFTNGALPPGHYSITKAQAKAAGIEWSFVVQSVEVLGLQMSNRHSRYGHSISRLA
jgi:hypothetical protein